MKSNEEEYNMPRKNIFQLVEENYDIYNEVNKIEYLFKNKHYFYSEDSDFSFKEIVSDCLLHSWKYSGTCIDVDEFFERVNADIDEIDLLEERDSLEEKDLSEEIIINYLEAIENFLKLFYEKKDELLIRYDLKSYCDFPEMFCKIINELERKMGLTKCEYKDRVILYKNNAPLEKVVELCEDEDVQWELIRYVREDLSLSEKRKTLAYLATNLYIEEDSKENDEHIKALIKKAVNILNNLHIRHNNKTGKWKNEALKDLKKTDAISLCDMVYNEMLTIVLLREHKEYEKTYTEFNKKQKEVKAKKKSEDNLNGKAQNADGE